MKKLHKVLMSVTAIVMAFSMTAMTACVDGEGGSNPGNNPGNISGGTEGGNTEGGNQGGNQGGNATVTKTDAQKTIEAFQNQSFKAVGVEVVSDTTSTYVSYSCDAEGKILDGATKEESARNSVVEISEKVNLVNYAGDMKSCATYTDIDADGNLIKSTENKYYGYEFLRDGYDFYVPSNDGIKEEITDFSNVTFHVEESTIPSQLEEILAQMPEDGVPAGLLVPITTFLNLADVYEGATFADKKLTVNLNKVVYGLYNDVVEVIENLDDDTTVGDIFTAAPVKNLIESLTYGLDAKEVYDQIYSAIIESGTVPKAQIDAVLVSVPKPEEGENVYSYLVKIIESKEVATLLGALASSYGITLPEDTAIADMKISEVITIVMGAMGGAPQDAAPAAPAAPSMEDIKAMLKNMLDGYVTVTEDKLTITVYETPTEYNKMDASAAQLVFNVGDDYTVSSIDFSVEAVTYYGNIYVGSTNNTWYDTVQKSTVTGSIELPATEYTLKDINKNKVEKFKYVLEDESQDRYVGRINDPAAERRVYDIYIGAEVKDGVLEDVKAYLSEYVDGKNKHVPIESSTFNGDSVSFTIEGVATCTFGVDIHVNEYNGSISVRLSAGNSETLAEHVYFEFQNTTLSFNAKRVTEEMTVEEILAQAK